jgi:O-antigen/teichoic acid export membrane protein
LSFGGDMTLTQLMLAVSAQLDSVLIGRFSGASELGLYRQASNLMKQPIERLRAPIFSVSQPGLSILQNQPARYRRYYARILFIVSLATVPLGAFAVVCADEIVLVALGQKWLGAVVFLRIFGVAAMIQPALGTAGTVMVTCGKSRRFLVVSFVSNTLVMILMFVGVAWGAVGIAAARVATSILLLPWALYYSFAGTPVSVSTFVRGVSLPLFASLTMAAALFAFLRYAAPDSAALSLAATCAIAPIVYFLTLLMLPGGASKLRDLVKELHAALKSRAST